MNGLGNLGQVMAAVNQNMQQMNANLRQMGDGVMQAANGFYIEAKRAVRAFDEQRGLRYRPATITLSSTIVGVGTASSGSADFRVAQNEDFLVQSMRGFIMLNALQSEPSLLQSSTAFLGTELPNGAGAGVEAWAMSPLDRMIAKAQNCRFTLLNKDTKVPITENEGLSLASITPECNGAIMVFSPDIVPGFIIPHNMTIQAQFSLQSANAFFNTASTSYGVSLTGVYVSREAR